MTRPANFKLYFNIALLFALTLITISNSFGISNKREISATTASTQMKEGYYLVVGVFSSESNVKRYSKYVDSLGYPNQYVFSEIKKMYYCYVMYSESVLELKPKYDELRQHKEFYSVWVLKILNNKESKILDIAAADSEDKKAAPAADAPKVQFAHNTASSKKAPAKPVRDLSATHHAYKVTITTKDQNGKEVPATIQVTHGEQDKVIANIKCKDESSLHIPKKEAQLVQLICEVFGYHRTELSLPLQDPIAMSALKNVKVDGDKITVELTLEKLQAGDLMVMFNVFFQPNSNIMRMKSQIDLETLTKILNENPTLKICVHGHTNGNSSGEIIKLKDENQDFFSPKEIEHTKGSSMKLSLLRAEAIKMYLVRQGISGDRITVKGWGGKKMIYKEDSPHYHLNVRVEVEVLEI